MLYYRSFNEQHIQFEIAVTEDQPDVVKLTVEDTLAGDGHPSVGMVSVELTASQADTLASRLAFALHQASRQADQGDN